MRFGIFLAPFHFQGSLTGLDRAYRRAVDKAGDMQASMRQAIARVHQAPEASQR